MTSGPESATDRPWWAHAVIYQVYLRSFVDGNGDGNGDIPGLIGKLDHIRGLGADAVWITPWYRSPMVDHGYDVSDYRDIDPMFGTLAQADELIECGPSARAARDPGLRGQPHLRPAPLVPCGAGVRTRLPGAGQVLLPGRARARRGTAPERLDQRLRRARLDPYRGPRRDTRPVVPAPLRAGAAGRELGQPAGARRVRVGPEVLVRPGRRRDADRRHLRAGQGARACPTSGWAPPMPSTQVHGWTRPCGTSTPSTRSLRSLRRVADEYSPRRMLLGEVGADRPDRFAAYLRADELHAAFQVSFMKAPWDAAALRGVIDSALGALAGIPALPTWALSTHDETRPVTRLAPTIAAKARRARSRPGCRHRCGNPPGPGRAPADARPARACQPLPGRRAGAAPGRHPRCPAPGPDLQALRRSARRPRRVPGAHTLAGHPPALRVHRGRCAALAAATRGLGEPDRRLAGSRTRDPC